MGVRAFEGVVKMVGQEGVAMAVVAFKGVAMVGGGALEGLKIRV